jgi:hypothetical protein
VFVVYIETFCRDSKKFIDSQKSHEFLLNMYSVRPVSPAIS